MCGKKFSTFDIKSHYTYKNNWALKNLRTKMCYLNRCIQSNIKKTLIASVDSVLQNMYEQYLVLLSLNLMFHENLTYTEKCCGVDNIMHLRPEWYWRRCFLCSTPSSHVAYIICLQLCTVKATKRCCAGCSKWGNKK